MYSRAGSDSEVEMYVGGGHGGGLQAYMWTAGPMEAVVAYSDGDRSRT